MPRIRNPRPKNTPRRTRPGDQLDLDGRCVACRCGVHRRRCMSAECTCQDDQHRQEETG